MHCTSEYDWWSLILFLVIIISIIIIVSSEYIAHDCIEHKSCNHSADRPSPDDSTIEYIEKLQYMVQVNNDFVIWRRALLAGLVACVPIIYYLRGRFPTWVEALVVILIIFVISYFVMTWLSAHYHYPNTGRIIEDLEKVKNRVKLEELDAKNDKID